MAGKASKRVLGLYAEGLALIRSEGTNAAKIAQQMIVDHWVGLSNADRRFLAALGLATGINGLAHHKRDQSKAARAAKRLRAETRAHVVAKSEERASEQIRQIAYRALTDIALDCGGRSKSLLDFTLEDIAAWQSSAGAQARGWKLRAEWFGRAGGHMKRIEATRIRDLPKSVLDELNASAEQAWASDAAA